MMNEAFDIQVIAKTLCRSSAVTQCPTCKGGECQTDMWATFTDEARAVIGAMERLGYRKPTAPIKTILHR